MQVPPSQEREWCCRREAQPGQQEVGFISLNVNPPSSRYIPSVGSWSAALSHWVMGDESPSGRGLSASSPLLERVLQLLVTDIHGFLLLGRVL